VDRNTALLDVDVPGQLWEALKEEGLLHERAPVPSGAAA
jgi:hypothetical protein